MTLGEALDRDRGGDCDRRCPAYERLLLVIPGMREPALDAVEASVGEAWSRIDAPKLRGDGQRDKGHECQQGLHAQSLRWCIGNQGDCTG